MKPKNLKFPFTWEERTPAVHEGVLIVPQYFEDHQNYDFSHLLPKDRPVSIEYCSGNGHWITEKAKTHSDRFWIAVEKQFERVRKIWSKMRNEGIENLLIVCGEALTFTQYYLSENLADEIFVNFPDPWPKNRHSKHRLIQFPFIEALSKVVKTGGHAVYATDDPEYADQMIEEMEKHPLWESVFPKPHYISDWDKYGWSWFQDLWEKKGRNFHFIQYRLK